MRKIQRESPDLLLARARFYSALELSVVGLLLVLCVWRVQGAELAPAVAPAQAQALTSPAANAYWEAIDGLAELGDRRAVPVLWPLLNHADQTARWAVDALGAIRDRAAAARGRLDAR